MIINKEDDHNGIPNKIISCGCLNFRRKNNIMEVINHKWKIIKENIVINYKTLMMMKKNKRGVNCPSHSYDPQRYALNFDDDAQILHYGDFASRFAHRRNVELQLIEDMIVLDKKV